jgi:dipeptidyl aminopeptidase/acylaminoacyl peptidase
MRLGRVWVAAVAAAVVSLMVVSMAAANPPLGTNGLLAFDNGNGDHDIVTADAVLGHPFTTVVGTAPNEFEPAWDPTGRKLAFAREVSNNVYHVLIGNYAGGPLTGIVDLTPSATDAINPVWSPDGQWIAFQSDVGPKTDIFLMRSDGTGQVDLTAGAGAGNSNFYPDFSPDGTKIAFTSDRTGNIRNIWVMGVDGSNPTRLTTDAGGDYGASWSPDGKSIAYQKNAVGTGEIWKMAADGSGQTRLTAGMRDDDPYFSPDGRQLVFDRFTTGPSDSEVMLFDLASGAVTNRSNDAGTDQTEPVWQDIQTCGGKQATIAGDDGPDVIKGTKHRDVIVANAAVGGKNVIKAKGGNDLICVGTGKAKVSCSGGKDKLFETGKGKKKETGCEVVRGKGKGKGK